MPLAPPRSSAAAHRGGAPAVGRAAASALMALHLDGGAKGEQRHDHNDAHKRGGRERQLGATDGVAQAAVLAVPSSHSLMPMQAAGRRRSTVCETAASELSRGRVGLARHVERERPDRDELADEQPEHRLLLRDEQHKARERQLAQLGRLPPPVPGCSRARGRRPRARDRCARARRWRHGCALHRQEESGTPMGQTMSSARRGWSDRCTRWSARRWARRRARGRRAGSGASRRSCRRGQRTCRGRR